MGLFGKSKEEYAKQYATKRESERQRLSALSEKELQIEMILLLKDMYDKLDDIESNQIIYGN